MINKIWKKIKDGWKRFWKWLAVGTVVTATTVGFIASIPDTVPPVMAEGEVKEFPFTDDNTGETLHIYGEQEEYRPLFWSRNGTEVLIAVDNKSGKSQDVAFRSYFTKDFTIEKVYLLDPNATATYLRPVYGDVCDDLATGTFCHTEIIGEKDVVLLGVWNEIPRGGFAKGDYGNLIEYYGIKVKPKVGDKEGGGFVAYSEKNTVKYYKLLVKPNESFGQAKFALEAIGSKGAWGLLDPTIFTENINSYPDGLVYSVASSTGWTLTGTDIHTIQGTTTFEGAKAVRVLDSSGGTNKVYRQDSAVADGRITVAMRADTTNVNHILYIRDSSGNTRGGFALFDDGTMRFLDVNVWSFFEVPNTYSANIWYEMEVEYRDSDNKIRYRVNAGNWATWVAAYQSTDPNTTWQRLDIDYRGDGYLDYIAQDPFVEAVAEEVNLNQVI